MPLLTLRSLIALFTVLLITVESHAGYVIGAFGVPRGGEFAFVDGSTGSIASEYIESKLPGVSVVGTQTLDAAFLSTVDVLLLSSASSLTTGITLSATEQDNLLAFVLSGKGAVIFSDGYRVDSGNSFAAPFGLSLGGTSSSTATVVDPLHPVANGPYGTISSFSVDPLGSRTGFTDLGPYATAVAISEAFQVQYPVVAAIAENAIAPGSGRVVLFSDLGTGYGSLLNDDGLVLNAVTYVAVPEARSVILVLIAIVLATGTRFVLASADEDAAG